jgi:hypothetical protein
MFSNVLICFNCIYSGDRKSYLSKGRTLFKFFQGSQKARTSGLIQGWWLWFGTFFEWILAGLKEHTEVLAGLLFMVCEEATVTE